MDPLLIIIGLLVLLLAYFVLVIITSRKAIETHRKFQRKADENKRIVLEYYETVLNGKKDELVPKYLYENYIQHDPFIATGGQAAAAAAHSLNKLYPDRKTEIKRVLAEGDYVFLHSLIINEPANTGDKGIAAIDIFRLENGMMAEHWNVSQPVPEKPANQNTMF